MLRDSLARKWSTSDNPNAQLFAQNDAGLDMKPYLCAAHVESDTVGLNSKSSSSASIYSIVSDATLPQRSRQRSMHANYT